MRIELSFHRVHQRRYIARIPPSVHLVPTRSPVRNNQRSPAPFQTRTKATQRGANRPRLPFQPDGLRRHCLTPAIGRRPQTVGFRTQVARLLQPIAQRQGVLQFQLRLHAQPLRVLDLQDDRSIGLHASPCCLYRFLITPSIEARIRCMLMNSTALVR